MSSFWAIITGLACSGAGPALVGVRPSTIITSLCLFTFYIRWRKVSFGVLMYTASWRCCFSISSTWWSEISSALAYLIKSSSLGSSRNAFLLSRLDLQFSTICVLISSSTLSNSRVEARCLSRVQKYRIDQLFRQIAGWLGDKYVARIECFSSARNTLSFSRWLYRSRSLLPYQRACQILFPPLDRPGITIWLVSLLCLWCQKRLYIVWIVAAILSTAKPANLALDEDQTVEFPRNLIET